MVTGVSGKKWKIVLLVLVGFNLILASWHLTQNDLYVHSDISRNFLLLHEIETKKIVLIGPRTGAAGMFHGPLWSYLNFPVYFLSHGNPVAVGWSWILATILFLWGSFKIVKKLFDSKTAYLYVGLISVYLLFQTREYSHQHMALLLMPLFFYTLVRYAQTLKVKFLGIHLLLAGALIQLEVAIGGPFLMLSTFYILTLIFKHKKWMHFSVFGLLLIPLSTYIAFDVRHDFIQLKSILMYMHGKAGEYYEPFIKILLNRLDYASAVGIHMLPKLFLLNRIFTVIMLVILIKLIRQKKHALIYSLFLYFFFGFFILSLTGKYYLLTHHFLPFVPIGFMILASLATSSYKKLLLPLLLCVLVYNEYLAIGYIQNMQQNFIGKDEDSWKFLSLLPKTIFESGDSQFGYFVFSPDKFAYEPKYAMIWGEKNYPNISASHFVKKPITYVISAPPPKADPFMGGEFWKVNSIKITKEATLVKTFPNGYQIERFELTKEEQEVAPDSYEDSGIHFR